MTKGKKDVVGIVVDNYGYAVAVEGEKQEEEERRTWSLVEVTLVLAQTVVAHQIPLREMLSCPRRSFPLQKTLS